MPWFRHNAEDDITAELRFHLEAETEANRARGMSPEDAARAARRRLGNWASVTERCRQERRWRSWADFGQDLARAARSLRRSPAAALAVIGILALGIGANSAIFTAVDAVVIRPLPYPGASRIVVMAGAPAPPAGPSGVITSGAMRPWRHLPAFSAVAAYANYNEHATLAGAGPARDVAVAETSRQLFRVMGVSPMLGRGFRPADYGPGRNREAILSHGLWQAAFGGRASVVGKQVTLRGRPYTVIGVMPPGFRFPGRTAVWLPFQKMGTFGNVFLTSTVARLRRHATFAQAQAEVTAETKALHPAVGFTNGNRVIPLARNLGHRYWAELFLLWGAAALVLLIACVNAAQLLLARLEARRRELAIRAALGAGRGRLLRLLIAESTLLALAAGAAGTALGLAAVRALGPLAPPALLRRFPLAVDWRVLAFSFLLALSAGWLVAGIPGWRAAGRDPREDLQGADRLMGRIGLRGRAALVAVELALATVLLAGAGLAIVSLNRMLAVNPGFPPAHLLTAQLMPAFPPPRRAKPAGENPAPAGGTSVNSKSRRAPAAGHIHMALGPKARQAAYQRAVESRLAALPGVRAVGLGSCVPFAHNAYMGMPFDVTAKPGGKGRLVDALLCAASPGYFRALGARLLAGRTFLPRDGEPGAAGVAIVDERFARHYSRHSTPLGRYIQLGGWMRIVGVVAQVDDANFPGPAGQWGTLYVDSERMPVAPFAVVARTAVPPKTLEAAMRRAVLAIAPSTPPTRMQTMNELIGRSVASPRFRAALLGTFAVLALLLAFWGVYAVLAHMVERRRAEMGVRMALGAGRGQVVRLVLRRLLPAVLVGTIVGLIAAGIAARLMGVWLFLPAAAAAWVVAASAAAILAASILAALLPARRAARLAPLDALRSE